MYAFCLNISEICMYSFARMCTINRLSRCYRVQSKLHYIRRSYQILLLPNSCTDWHRTLLTWILQKYKLSIPVTCLSLALLLL